MKLWNNPKLLLAILILGHTQRYSGLTLGDGSWWGPYWGLGINPVWLHARQMPDKVYSKPNITEYS